MHRHDESWKRQQGNFLSYPGDILSPLPFIFYLPVCLGNSCQPMEGHQENPATSPSSRGSGASQLPAASKPQLSVSSTSQSQEDALDTFFSKMPFHHGYFEKMKQLTPKGRDTRRKEGALKRRGRWPSPVSQHSHTLSPPTTIPAEG